MGRDIEPPIYSRSSHLSFDKARSEKNALASRALWVRIPPSPAIPTPRASINGEGYRTPDLFEKNALASLGNFDTSSFRAPPFLFSSQIPVEIAGDVIPELSAHWRER